MAKKTRMSEIELAKVKHKLAWAASGEWSAYVKPAEARLLIIELNKKKCACKKHGS